MAVYQVLEFVTTYQVERATNQVVPHTGTILTASTTNEHNAVLLNVVALTGNVSRNHTSCRQSHTRRFSLARVRLLGPRDSDLEADSLLERGLSLGKGWRHGVSRLLSFSAALFPPKQLLETFDIKSINGLDGAYP